MTHLRAFSRFAPLCLPLALAACQSVGVDSIPATGAGITSAGTFTRIKNHDPNKWTMTPAGPQKWRLVCRPLACPEPSLLVIERARSPTRDPDPAALQKFARETVPAALKATDIQTSTATSGYVHFKLEKTVVGQVRGFPTVSVDFTRTGVGAPDHGARTYLFAGNTLISVMSVSKSKGVAHRNLDDYIAALDILDQAPPQAAKVGLSSPPTSTESQEKK
jgi:hypothetical protein